MNDDLPRTSSLYRTMRTIRRFEESVVELVNANEIPGLTHESIGQEAVPTGVCAVLRRDDIITSTHRGHGHVIAKGADVRLMMAELFGRENGLNRGRGGSMHIADLSLGIFGANGLVAAGTPFAAGGAWAALQEGSDRVAVTFFGDGGVNQGVLHETMNLAGAWRLPVVFLCENNGYAITMPIADATAGDIVARAAAYGMPAESVDGMDVEAVIAGTRRAVEHARQGRGPAFLECRTYRFAGHHTAEAVFGLSYRSDEEIERWRARDPLSLTGERLDPAERDRIDDEVEQLIAEAIGFARAGAHPLPETATDHMYADGTRPRAGVA
jgi:pyruvate dehydrogenase E1 component alpha subunit